jgi:hypothetical protein
MKENILLIILLVGLDWNWKCYFNTWILVYVITYKTLTSKYTKTPLLSGVLVIQGMVGPKYLEW